MPTATDTRLLASFEIDAVHLWAGVVGLMPGRINQLWRQAIDEEAKLADLGDDQRAAYVHRQQAAILEDNGYYLPKEDRQRVRSLLDRGRNTAFGHTLAESDVAKCAWLLWSLAQDCRECFVVKRSADQ